MGFVHSTTNRWWSRCHKSDTGHNNVCETNRWVQIPQNRWRLDNQETSNTQHGVGWLNKLWGKQHLQGWVHPGWPWRNSRSKESNRHPSPTAADRTGKTRSWVDTPTIQKLVSGMRPKQGTTEQSSKADSKTASHPSWRHLLQVTCREASNTNSDHNRRRDRHVHGGTNRRPNKQHGIPVNMSPAVSDGMWQNTRHPEQHRHTVRSGRLPDSTTQDDSSNIRRQPGGQHTPHKHKAAWKGSTEHWWDKWEHSSCNSRTTTEYTSQASIPSCHGWWNTQHTSWTGTPYTQTATPATTGDGTRSTKHQSASLVKQFFTCHQQQSTLQRWSHGSFQQTGWERTQQQAKTSSASPARSSKQERSDDR